jgi:osmoprotectant transport system permease protein
MIALNARAKLDHVPESEVAADSLREAQLANVAPARESVVRTIGRHAAEHTLLVLLSLLAAIAVGVPLGILAARRPRLGRVVVGAAGLLQTVPSIALLVLLIPPARHPAGADGPSLRPVSMSATPTPASTGIPGRCASPPGRRAAPGARLRLVTPLALPPSSPDQDLRRDRRRRRPSGMESWRVRPAHSHRHPPDDFSLILRAPSRPP